LRDSELVDGKLSAVEKFSEFQHRRIASIINRFQDGSRPLLDSLIEQMSGRRHEPKSPGEITVYVSKNVHGARR
jgi:hypothetical protein